MRTSLCLFHRLCTVGNALEDWRERFPPGSGDWTAATDMLGALDAAIDLLVDAQGRREEDAHAPARG